MQKKKEEQTKKKYSIWSNYRYIYRELWNYDKKMIFFSVIEVLLRVAVAFGAVYTPSLIVGMLEQRMPVGQMAGRTLLLFLLYGGICAGNMYLYRRNMFQFVEFRVGHMCFKRMRKTIDLDYFQYEDKTIQRMSQTAGETFWGNQTGLEGILHSDVDVAASLLGLLLYAGLISGASAWIVLMLVVISVVQIGTFQAANRYELRHREKKGEISVTQNYLDRQAYDVAVGKDIRLYQLGDWLGGLYREVNKKYQSLVAKERSCYFANDLVGVLLQFGRDLLCYGYLIHLLKRGMAVSQFVLYIGIIAGFSSYFSELTKKITELGKYHKSVGFFREFMDIEPEFHHGEGAVLERQETGIEVEFSHVSFAYPHSGEESHSAREQQEDGEEMHSAVHQKEDGEKMHSAVHQKEDGMILDDVSFTIKKGEKLALVGINGAGKSTIVKLLCGFYHPTSGHIYVNGRDISELDLEEYYKDLAVVFQEAFTFSFSIADNISCCTRDAYDREKCVDALKRAGLWEKIESLPKKEETCLNKDIEEDGVQLSGGQMQKLMLARALYKDCRLLLLDEPTAALDAIAENEMYQKYEELLEGRSTLFISHRLASTRFCDRILFLEHGKISEEGTHEELMEKKGGYAHMFEVQSQYYREGGDTDESKTCMA